MDLILTAHSAIGEPLPYLQWEAVIIKPSKSVLEKNVPLLINFRIGQWTHRTF